MPYIALALMLLYVLATTFGFVATIVFVCMLPIGTIVFLFFMMGGKSILE